MDLPSDTPPDGDFVRYVEKLAAASEAAVFKKQAVTDTQARRSAVPAAARPARREAVQGTAPVRPAGPSLWTVGKWVILAWVALQLVAVFIPQASTLAWPLLAAFGTWLVYRLKNASGGLLTHQLRRMAERAAKELTQRK